MSNAALGPVCGCKMFKEYIKAGFISTRRPLKGQPEFKYYELPKGVWPFRKYVSIDFCPNCGSRLP